jgi:putative cell wall-binding protein
VASGTNWPDALAASGLAGSLQAPLLLTKPAALSSTVKTYIQQLDADRIAVVGGTAAVSDAVATELATVVGGAANVQRYGGTTRYSTANLIAGITVTASGRPAWDHIAFLATGGNFPDALAAGPLSAAEGRPLYLAHPTTGVSDATIAAMLSADVQRVIVLGGPSVVSQASIDKIKAAGITIGTSDRWYGTDRYDTARVVAQNSLTAGLTASATGLATGEDFPDALAGGVSQGLSGSVLVLTKSATLSGAASTFLNSNAASIDEVRFFGGLAALSSGVRTAAITAATP